MLFQTGIHTFCSSICQINSTIGYLSFPSRQIPKQCPNDVYKWRATIGTNRLKENNYVEHFSGWQISKCNSIEYSSAICKIVRSHNWTVKQLWTATPILSDAAKCSHLGCMQSDVLTATPRQQRHSLSMLWRLCSWIPENSEEWIIIIKTLHNRAIRKCKFERNWEYWPCLEDYTSISSNWSHTLQVWLINCFCLILQFDKLSSFCIVWFRHFNNTECRMYLNWHDQFQAISY